MNSITYSQLTPLAKLKLATEKVLGMDPSVRPRDMSGKPGALIEVPEHDTREYMIVGDLHAMKRNLKYLLFDSGNLRKLWENRLVIVFLGDIVHNENTGEITEMDSSLVILDIVLHLITRYPKNIIYLLGNHDTFDPNLFKSGIAQGVLFRKKVEEKRGQDYVDALAAFFKALPLFVRHRSFLAVHAGPVRNGLSREQIINAYSEPNHIWQMVWNRLNETRSNPSMKEYSPEDLEAQRRLLACRPDIPVIVGHNPMWKWGGDDSVWINPIGVKNHVILYSNLPKKCPYLSFCGDDPYKVKYADLRIKKRRFVLDDYS